METPAQNPAVQTANSPEAKMPDAVAPQSTLNDTFLNALLIESEPLAFLESLIPGNEFVSLNNTASALLPSLDFPEIQSSISTALIKELRNGQRTIDTAILSDLTLRANESSTITEECASSILKYQERLTLQQRDIPPLLVSISSLATKLASVTLSGNEAENSVFQYSLALAKLTADLNQIVETNPGLSLNATSRLPQADTKALLRNYRYTTLS
jgi:hypothetical protein